MFAKQFYQKYSKQLLTVAHQLLVASYGLIILLILYRVSSKEEIGRWVLFVSTLSFFDMFQHGFFQTTIVRLIASQKQKKSETETIVSNVLCYGLLIWTLLSVLVLIVGVAFSQSQLTMDMRWYLPIGLAMLFYNIFWWIGNAQTHFGYVFLQRLVFTVSSLAIVFLSLFFLHKMSFTMLALSQVLGYTMSVLTMVMLNNKIKFKFNHINSVSFRYFFSYGKYTTGSMLMGSILRNADVYMITVFLGKEAVAIYSVAQKGVELFEIPLRGVAVYSFTNFCRYRENINALQKHIYAVFSRLVPFMALASFILFLSASLFVHAISGSAAYDDSIVLLRIFMVYVNFLAIDRMVGVVLEALGLVKQNFVKTIVVASINLSGNLIVLACFSSLGGVAIVSIFAILAGIISGIYFLQQSISPSVIPEQLIVKVNYNG